MYWMDQTNTYLYYIYILGMCGYGGLEVHFDEKNIHIYVCILSMIGKYIQNKNFMQ